MDWNGQSVLEGVSDSVLLLFTGIMVLVGTVTYWARAWSGGLMARIHPSMESTMEEVRSYLGLAGAGGSHADDSVDDDVDVDARPSSSGDAAPRRARQPSATATCPICFGAARLPVETNCGHVFCCLFPCFDGGCITGYWRYTRSPLETVRCPVCRTDVSLLLALFPSIRAEADAGGRDAEAVGHMHDYNRRFSGQPRSLWDHVRDLPVLLRHLFRRLTSFDGLMLVFRLRVIVCLASIVLYVLSPLDILPEAVLGFFGFVDDFFVTAVMLVYATSALRQLVGHEADAH